MRSRGSKESKRRGTEESRSHPLFDSSARPFFRSASPPLVGSSVIPFLGTWVPRVVTRFVPDLLGRQEDGTRTLYLTFDDGPDVATPALLDLLARHDARATFFLIGSHARQYPDLVRAVRDAGHTIGQHTETHVDAWRTPHAAVEREMQQATAALEDATGQPVRWMRPPHGHVTGPMRTWCRAAGQQIALWDVMPGDFLPSTTAHDIVRRTLGWARPGSLVVLHEGGHARRVTPPALDVLLPRLRADGYRFGTL